MSLSSISNLKIYKLNNIHSQEEKYYELYHIEFIVNIKILVTIYNFRILYKVAFYLENTVNNTSLIQFLI